MFPFSVYTLMMMMLKQLEIFASSVTLIFSISLSMRMKKQQKNLKSPALCQWLRTALVLEYPTALIVNPKSPA